MSFDPILDRIRIVLVEPSHPANVGACARAMKTMGLRRLVLVDPARPGLCEHDEAVALASGAVDVLQAAQVVATTALALTGVHCALGLSARRRELAIPSLSAKSAAIGVVERLWRQPAPFEAALLFGAERTGLRNEDLLLCQAHVTIDTDAAYASLNLSQAVQVLCYELRQACLLTAARQVSAESSPTLPAPVTHTMAASSDDVERLYQKMLIAMAQVDFLNPARPKKLIARVRRLLSKASLEKVEVDLLHGFLSDVIRVARGRLYPHEQANQQPLATAPAPTED
jgi:tRNA/rRNA methyltransferase